MRLVPVTDGAVKAGMPVEGKEQHGTVIEVGENIYHRVNHTAKDKRQLPMSARVGSVHEAPKQNGVDDERGWRMQKVMAGNPPGIVEIGWMNNVLHQVRCILLENETVDGVCSPRQQSKGNIGRNRTPQKSGLGEFELCAEFLFDGGIDNKVGGEGVQRRLRIMAIGDN